MAATALLATGSANAAVNPGGGRNPDGTPVFVRDGQGIALTMCADTLICEPAASPDIGAYYSAEATAGPISAAWGIEAAFLENEAGVVTDRAAVGNSAVFRGRDLRPGRVYTIRDPWRTYRCRADNRGRLDNKNCLFEGGGEAGGPMRRGPIKSFLVPRFSIAAGLIGGLTGSRVTGSPTGFNRFSVEGPGLNVRTRFFTVSGQLLAGTPMGVVSRTQLRLGGHSNNRPVTKAIRYRSVGTAPARVRTRKTGDRGAFRITNNCRGGVAPGRSCSIEVTYRPTRADKNARLVISDNTMARPRSVRLSGIAPR
jgi:hypothetical protein